MISLVTLEQTKLHLNITDNSRDFDIKAKALQASAIVMKYCKFDVVPDEWQSGSPITYDIPTDIQAAVLLTAGELFMNRESSTAEVLSQGVKDLLVGYWDPALA